MTERLTDKSYCISDICAIQKETFYEDMECRRCFDLYTGKAIDKLAEYEDLEEQNRLLKLPCKAGQKVFLLRKDIKIIIDGEITSIRIGEFASDMKIFMIDDNRYTDASFDKIGDIVFFTKEAAEAALKELERGKGE